ncbi:MAG: nitroreductase family protein [bacterium]
MDALEAIKSRHSIRNFDGKPVKKEDIAILVDAGRTAPSALAVHPWEFVAVTGRESLTRLSEICDHGKFIKSAGAALVVLCADTKYFLEDGCASTENILVAASALGIGSCWVAGDKKDYAPKILEMLGAPEGFRLVSVIALGYSAEKVSGVQKRPLEEVLHWEKF